MVDFKKMLEETRLRQEREAKETPDERAARLAEEAAAYDREVREKWEKERRAKINRTLIAKTETEGFDTRFDWAGNMTVFFRVSDRIGRTMRVETEFLKQDREGPALTFCERVQDQPLMVELSGRWRSFQNRQGEKHFWFESLLPPKVLEEPTKALQQSPKPASPSDDAGPAP